MGSPCLAHLSVHTILLQLADISMSAFRWHHQHQPRPFSLQTGLCQSAWLPWASRRYSMTSITRIRVKLRLRVRIRIRVRGEAMKVQILLVALKRAATLTFKVKHFSKTKPLQKSSALAGIIVVGASLKWTRDVALTLYMLINTHCIQGLILSQIARFFTPFF